MYKIIGADQKEYGPVTAEQLRHWIAQGRANGQSRVQAEGSADWKPLSEFPEFAGALKGKAGVSSPPPKVRPTEGDKLAAEISARDYRLDVIQCFSRSWNLLKENFWLLVGAPAVMLLISVGLWSIPLLGLLGFLALTFPMCGGLSWLFLKRARGQPADISDAFAGFVLALGPLALASVVTQLLTYASVFLCVLPAIYLFVAWWAFTPLLIIDKKLDFWPAMECSRKVVTKHWWTCFGLLILTVIVSIAGLLACGIGIFISLPIAIGASVYAYEDIFGARPSVTAPMVTTPPQSDQPVKSDPPPDAAPPVAGTTPASQ